MANQCGLLWDRPGLSRSGSFHNPPLPPFSPPAPRPHPARGGVKECLRPRSSSMTNPAPRGKGSGLQPSIRQRPSAGLGRGWNPGAEGPQEGYRSRSPRAVSFPLPRACGARPVAGTPTFGAGPPAGEWGSHRVNGEKRLLPAQASPSSQNPGLAPLPAPRLSPSGWSSGPTDLSAQPAFSSLLPEFCSHLLSQI